MKHNYKRENAILIRIIKDIMWCSVRYAHGRHTYVSSIVRDAMKEFKKICPEYKYRDITIEPPDHECTGMDFRSDYLDDLLDK